MSGGRAAMLVRLHLLLPLALACRRETLGRGDVFRCDAELSESNNARFYMYASDPHVLGHAFEIFVNMSLASPSSSDFNASECLQKRKTEAVFGYLSNYVWFHQEGRLNETGECGDQRIHAVLFCVQSEGPPAGSLFFTAAVESEYSANVHLVAKTQSSPHWGQRNFTLTYGSIWGGSAFHMFTIPDEADIDLWRLRIQPHVLEDLNGKEFPTSDVYLMPESSECVSDVLTNGGCFDFTQVQTCVKSVPVSFRAPEKTASSKVAMHQSFQSQATLTLSRGSLPFLQPGRWILFVMCRHDRDCPATLLSVESYPEYRLRWKLIWGTLLAVLGMFLILFSVNTLYWLAYFILNKCSPETEENAGTTNRLWPVIIGVCGRDHVSMMRDKAMKVAQPLPFFPALLSLMVGVFLATAAQFVITHYGLMIRSGNRDICFYNDQCYYPGMVWDIPWNHAISNLGYFVAGAHVILQAFYAETRCRTFSRRAMSALFRSMDAAEHGCIRFSHWQHFFSEADRNRSGRVSRAEWKYQYKNPIAFDWIDANGDGCLEKSEWDAAFRRLDTQSEGVVRECDFVKQAKEIDLRAFYAIGVSFAAEGVGSMCYHLCPSVETFQFDTCFMIPIANLLTLALLDWDHSGHDEITALKYFVYILTPVWLVNFIGTWYDIGVFPIGWIYWIYAALVILWATVVLLAGMRRIVQSPGRAGHITKRALQVLLVICIAVAFLFPNVRVVYFSGTANLFLELSVVVMIVVIGRQLYLEDFRYVTCQMRHIGARVIKHFYGLIMITVAVLALKCFAKKVVLVEPEITPAQSRNFNQDCVFDIFDLHDVWHFLSAVALALFAMLLLDVRVNSWARKAGIQVLFEELPVDLSDSSDGDEVCYTSDSEGRNGD